MILSKPMQLLKRRSTTLPGAMFLYTLIFAAVCLVVFSVFLLFGKSFVINTDGIAQHIPALSYMGRWGREIIRNIFSGNFTIPVWDFSIGYGADAVTTMHYYGLGDPLTLLFVLVPTRYTEYMYGFLIILRLWLSGVTFILYCRRMEQDLRAAVLGAVLYTFCGWNLVAAIRHPFFTTPMIYFPLILIGAEKVLKRENPLLFIVSVALCLLSSFYFSYMVVIFVILYVVLRFVYQKHDHFIKEMFADIGRFVGFALVAMLTAAVIFLPILIVFFGNSRSDVSYGTPLLYPLNYYESLISQFMGYQSPLYWNTTAYTPLCLVGVAFIFLKKGQYKLLKTATLILLVCQLFPFIGSALTGFAYVTNRFVWVFAFLLDFIVVYTLKDLLHASQEEKRKLVLWVTVYTLLSFLVRSGRNLDSMVQFTLLFAVLLVLLGGSVLFRNPRSGAAALAVIGAFSVCANGFFCNSPTFANYVVQFENTGEAMEKFENSPSTVFAKHLKIKENRFHRYESEDKSNYRINQSVANGTAGLSFYFSLTDNRVINYLHEMEVPVYNDIYYYDLDHRAFLDSLASVRYYTAESTNRVPYGYTQVKEKDGHCLFRNKRALPLGYTYDSVITRSAYDTLSSVEKQEALMQSVLLEEDSAHATATPTLTSSEIAYTVIADDNVLQTEQGVYVKKAGATATLQFEGVKNSETYVRFKNLQAEHLDDYELMQHLPEEYADAAEQDSAYTNVLRWYNHLYKNSPHSYYINVAANGVTQTVRLFMPEHQFYSGVHDFTVNLGYTEKPQTSATIAFPTTGFYSWDDLQVICQPMDNYKKYTKALSEDVLENLSLTDNRVSGTVSLEEDKILCLTIPYSKGWTCTVDGQKTDLLRANTWCMAIPLTAGNHDIRLEYKTPGLAVGAVCTVVGLALTVAIALYYARKKKRG